MGIPGFHHSPVPERKRVFVHIEPQNQKPKLYKARWQEESNTREPQSLHKRTDILREESRACGCWEKSLSLSIRKLPSGLLNFSPKHPHSWETGHITPKWFEVIPEAAAGPPTQSAFPEVFVLKTKRFAFYSFISPVCLNIQLVPMVYICSHPVQLAFQNMGVTILWAWATSRDNMPSSSSK